MENCASASPLFKKLMSILIKDSRTAAVLSCASCASCAVPQAPQAPQAKQAQMKKLKQKLKSF
jgi:hypothetical protein